MKRSHLIFVMLLALLCIGGYLFADYSTNLPIDTPRNWVGRESCASCHQQQVELFTGSHHDKAMDLATDATVLADFDDQTLEHFGLTSRMFRDGDKFMVHTEGPDGEMQDFEVKYTFGVEPLQQYMVELEQGRVQVLRLSWDTHREKWFYLPPPDVDSKLDPSDPLHWTGITQNWNTSCAFCHSTNLQKNFDLATNTFNTTWSEIDVSCEACHGPASLHNELMANAGIFPDRNHGTGLINLKTKNNLHQIQTCAPCHSRRTAIDETWKPGCNFDDYFALQPLTEPFYFADGQIREEDYVHGSFIQSKMYHAGIKCSDCHDPHSLKLKHHGNNVCTSCHQHPAGKYDSIAHHHHQPGTEGARCVSCHMPSTTYMVVDARRDHSFRVPRPDLSQLNGTPNACTKCHLELETQLRTPAGEKLVQYLDWIIKAESGDKSIADILAKVDKQMSDATMKWYPPASSPPKTQWYPDMAEVQRLLRENQPTQENVNKLLTNAAWPDIVRATTLLAASNTTDPSTAIKQLSDDDPKVISAAISTIAGNINNILSEMAFSQTRRQFESKVRDAAEPIVPLLTHPSRRVRVDAAQALVMLPPSIRSSVMFGKKGTDFDNAIREYASSLMISAENAGAHVMLGRLHEQLGNPDLSIESYRNAIQIDPNMTGPRSNLASLLDDKTRPLAATQRTPAIDKQIQRLEKEITDLRKQDHELLAIDVQRAEGLAGTDALHYRFAMSSYLQQDIDSAEKHMLIAYKSEPANPTYSIGLSTLYIQLKRFDDARKFVDHLLQLDPNHPTHLALKKQLDSKSKQ